MTEIDYGSFVTLHPSGRFKISNTPPLPPGKCVICGSIGGDGREFIDFGFDIDYYGVVYFCTICMVEGCNHLGYINHAQWSSLQGENERLLQLIQKYEVENANLRAGLNAFTAMSNGSSNAMDNRQDGSAIQGTEVRPSDGIKEEGNYYFGLDEPSSESGSEHISSDEPDIKSPDSDFDFSL